MSPSQESDEVQAFERLDVRLERLGLVAEPDGSPNESGGVLNPAATRTRDRELLIYPRCVADGNISRVGTMRVREADGGFATERLDFALVPQAPYEIRPHPGYGCEDPRVTYVPILNSYVMAYTAFGPDGPRIAIALSEDAYHWTRIGLVRFEGAASVVGDDKDAAFFPEPVLSPSGKRCLAFYHRPMLHLSSVDGRAAIPMIERMPFEDRESIRIGYVELDPVLANRASLCDVSESTLALSPDAQWGSIKIGGGTPPVKIALNGVEAWLAFFHGVEAVGNGRRKPSLQYSAGIVIHDLQRPDKILYRSPRPVLAPLNSRERKGVVDNVVFPTGLDPRPDLGEHVYDVYYGMGDYSVGAARVWISAGAQNA